MDDVRGDFLRPPHGTTPAALIGNEDNKEIKKQFKQETALFF